MSEYINGFSLNIAEISRLQFHDNVNGSNKPITEVVMHYEALKGLHQFIGNTINEHEEKMAKQAQTNKGMN